jgi:hypothetical protein
MHHQRPQQPDDLVRLLQVEAARGHPGVLHTQSAGDRERRRDEPQEVSFGEINLIGTDEWVDLIRGSRVEDHGGKITLAPYQCVWLTNLF